MPISPRRPRAVSPWRELFRASGLRCTPARDAVLDFLSRRGCPLAHREIAAARGLADLDRVTLYRTLAALQAAGFVHRVQDASGAWRFCAHVRDGRRRPANHPHFQCTRCGRMRCLADQVLPHVTVRGRERVTGKQLVAYGLCAACAARAGR